MCLTCPPNKIRPRVLYKKYGITIGNNICWCFFLIIGGIRYYTRYIYYKIYVLSKI